jgi:large repetitive protein
VIEYYPEILTGTPQNLELCSNSDFATFDLTVNTPLVLASLNSATHTLGYYLTQTDAVNQTNLISTPSAFLNTVALGQTIYVAVKNTITGCVKVVPFTILVKNSIPQFTVPQNVAICQSGSGQIVVTPINYQNSSVTYVWNFNNVVIPNQSSSTLNVTQAGSYTVTVTNNGCSTSATILVNELPLPSVPVISNVEACESYALPSLPQNQAYYTQTNGGGQMLAAGTVITQNTTLYVLANSGTTPNCFSEASFTITIYPAFAFEINGECVGSTFILSTNLDSNAYTFKWFNSSQNLLGENATQVVSNPGTYICIVENIQGFVCENDSSKFFDNVICEIQKGISPNGDGLNDVLKIKANSVEIFNRYGIKVYDKTDYDNDWKGQSNNNEELPNGTYYYVIKLLNEEIKTGWIYLNTQN